ncbi:cytochrome P450 4d8 [Diabrotica virgifera virgifera]|uniref:Cytochrome P450 4d8-like isoform X1 n=1 Tax=Diabrotica virgifera virgifera TaxID=50390 RepID=A0A6P7GCJ9_DIAVI|nr:cytochrome P450 4d8 [Diabrotica virgifera virgifera]XP_028142016.1 cytochrome P450 4d8 [Diabrotica virgifera virgifera]XP_028142017.1 cytochrome P450 4d8 [Diabrotica virgifera virgifera]XP_050497656.1 cytochrome P450 4d8 [Diabrotica virgifera virgifera]
MAVVLALFVGAIVAAISYWWMGIYRIRSKLHWIPEIPRLPLIGNALELKKTTEILGKFEDYLSKHNGLCTIELATYKFIVTSDPTFLEFLLGKTDILNKSDEYQFLGNWLGKGLLTAAAPKWKRSRKMLTPSFHFSILDVFVDTFDSNAAILVDLLDKETNKDSFDIFPYVKNCTMDVICETSMGVSIHAQKNPKSDYVRAVAELCRLLILRTYSPLKTFDFFYRLTSDYKLEMEQVKILHSHTMQVITSRKEELKKKHKDDQKEETDDVGIKKRKAFLDLLLETTIDGRPLTDTEIREEVDTFLFAGHDTTAAAISFCLYCLSVNKDVQDKIAQEQKQIFGENKNRNVTIRDIQEMKYLELALKESLRMYPPVPYVGRKADRDVVYTDGNIIPKGTALIIVIYWANRNPKYFPDPDIYNPSRFENTTDTHPYTYIPFSAGPRNCIGQKYAWNLMKTIISKVLRNYELEPSGHKLQIAAETVLKSENGVKVKLRKRDWDQI